MARIKTAGMIKYSSIRKALSGVNSEMCKSHEQMVKKILEEHDGSKTTGNQKKGSFLGTTR